MEKIKQGDFVRNKALKTAHKCTNVNEGEFGNKISTVPSFSFDSEYMNQYEKWIPEPGAWCWFWDNETDVPTLAKLISISKLFDRKETYTVATPSCISESSYNYSTTMTFSNCEPFVRELPSNLKD